MGALLDQMLISCVDSCVVDAAELRACEAWLSANSASAVLITTPIERRTKSRNDRGHRPVGSRSTAGWAACELISDPDCRWLRREGGVVQSGSRCSCSHAWED